MLLRSLTVLASCLTLFISLRPSAQSTGSGRMAVSDPKQLHSTGIDHLRKGEYDRTIEIGQALIERASSTGNDDDRIVGYDLLIAANIRLNNYSKAISYCLYVQNNLCSGNSEACQRIQYRILQLMRAGKNYQMMINLNKQRAKIMKENGRIRDLIYVYTDLARAYLHTEHIDSVFYFSKEVLNLPKDSISRNDRLHQHNNMGLAHRALEEFDSAKLHFRTMIGIIDAVRTPLSGDSILRAVAHFNLSKTMIMNKEYGESIALLKGSLIELERFRQWKLVVNGQVFLAGTLSERGDHSSALDILESALSTTLKISDPGLELKVLRAMLDLSYGSEIPLDKDLLGKYLWLKDSLDTEKAKRSDAIEKQYTKGILSQERSRRQLADQRIHSQKAAFQQEREIDKLQDRLMMLLGLIGIAIPTGIFLRYRSIQRSKHKQLVLEEARAKSELELKKDHITKMALDISRKREFAEDLISRLNELREDRREIGSIVNFIKTEQNLDRGTFEFEDYVSKVNFKFIETLERTHPDLSKTDIKLCIMVKLGLTNKEIANIEQILPDSVKTAKKRLRKKLGLGPDERAFDYLNGETFADPSPVS